MGLRFARVQGGWDLQELGEGTLCWRLGPVIEVEVEIQLLAANDDDVCEDDGRFGVVCICGHEFMEGFVQSLCLLLAVQPGSTPDLTDWVRLDCELGDNS